MSTRFLTAALLAAVTATLIGCSTPPTIDDRQTEVIRELKLYLAEKHSWDPELVTFKYDEFNSAWDEYWGGGGLELTPEARKWHDQLYKIWVYQVLPAEETNYDADILWIFVDRQTGAVLGDMKAR